MYPAGRSIAPGLLHKINALWLAYHTTTWFDVSNTLNSCSDSSPAASISLPPTLSFVNAGTGSSRLNHQNNSSASDGKRSLQNKRRRVYLIAWAKQWQSSQPDSPRRGLRGGHYGQVYSGYRVRGDKKRTLVKVTQGQMVMASTCLNSQLSGGERRKLGRTLHRV